MFWTEKHFFLTVLKAGYPRSGYCQGLSWWGPPSKFADSCLPIVSLHGREQKGRGWSTPISSLLIRVLIPIMSVPSCWPNNTPKAPPPNTVTRGVRISTYHIVGDTNLQSITIPVTLKKNERDIELHLVFGSIATLRSFRELGCPERVCMPECAPCLFLRNYFVI